MAAASVFVVDASVAVKWFVPELDRAEAIRLREDFVRGAVDLFAPDLLIYEVGNALRFHPKATEAISAAGVRSLRTRQLVLEGVEDGVFDGAMGIARAEGITFYDAIYLALAEGRQAKMITADERLVRSLREYRRRVLRLREYARQG